MEVHTECKSKNPLSRMENCAFIALTKKYRNMLIRKSARQTTHHLCMFWIYFKVWRSVPSKITLKGRPYANLCPLLPSLSIQISVVKCRWLLKQSLHTYKLDRNTRAVCVVFQMVV